MTAPLSRFGQKGAIVRIRLRNFMTYTDTTLAPGPNLNMVLGPNGSGKSAIVCSIIVGLAGEVSLTGRATSPAGLVKKGCEWGSTEIELYNDRRDNYIIKRKIIITGRSETNKLDHKSEWSLNGQTVIKSEIQKLISRLNIKVDNLCQFLPQDSVAAFVKMNSSELLTSTLKAAGDNQLVVDHTKLIDLTLEIQDNKQKLNRIKQDCEHNQINCARLEADVEKLREREKLVKMKKICDQKIYHVRYMEAKNSFEVGKQELNEMNTELHRSQSSSEPYKRAVETNREHITRLKRLVETVSQDSSRTFELVERAKSSIEQRKIDCQQQFTEFQRKQDEEQHRESAIRLEQQKLQGLENSLVDLTTQDYSREIDGIKRDMVNIREKLMQSNNKKGVVTDKLSSLIRSMESIKARIEQIKSVREKKMNLVFNRRPHAVKVTEWYARNRDKFREEIYPPMMCDINVKNPKDSAVIEHAIQESDLMAFICQTEEDVKKLSSVARRELNAKINVILKPDKTLSEFESEAPRTRFPADFPFKAYLKDLIDAPDAIMRYLCGNYNFHQVPVFNECTEQQLKYLLENCRKFYVGNKFYNVSVSRYDQQTITVSDTVRDARLLIHSFDKKGYEESSKEFARVSQLRSETETERSDVSREVDSLKEEWSTKESLLTKLNAEVEKRRRIEALIERCKVVIEKYRTQKIDLELERSKLQDAIKTINLKLMKDVERLADIYKNCVKSHESICLNTLLHSIAVKNYKISVKKYENAVRDSKRLELEIKKQKLHIEALQKEMTRQMDIASEKIAGFKQGKLDKATLKKFDEVEEVTVDLLEQKIEELKARIQGIHRDPSVLNEFERQNQELQDKRQKIAELESTLEMKESDRREIKNNWLPKLGDVIGEIDVHYRDFMRKLRYDGQVKLDFDQSNAENFSTYGIMIMVKYRDNEQLIPLSSTRQSGGERSVATMIYMLALQTTTTVPFRCVDEINQGMDKENERKVFELLVQTADESSSQYFLVSPKLLKDLPYTEKMKIHVVFNGQKLKLDWNELGSDGDQDGDNNDEDDTDVEVEE